MTGWICLGGMLGANVYCAWWFNFVSKCGEKTWRRYGRNDVNLMHLFGLIAVNATGGAWLGRIYQGNWLLWGLASLTIGGFIWYKIGQAMYNLWDPAVRWWNERSKCPKSIIPYWAALEDDPRNFS